MTPDNTIIPLKYIQGMIFTIRGVPVMVDRDLADIYQVENKRLNEQVKRNLSRFPEAFRFQLTDAEKEQLVANCDRFDSMKHASSNPYVFTEQGVSMLSAVLRSETAIKVSIQIINASVEMRHFLQSNADLFAASTPSRSVNSSSSPKPRLISKKSLKRSKPPSRPNKAFFMTAKFTMRTPSSPT